jgi:aspartate beta-hydroxylase
MGNQSYLSR